METGNGCDKTEAEPIAGGAATPFQPVKSLEYMLTFIDRNSRPVIGDRNDGAALALSDLHRHPTGFTAMFEGIVDEIGQIISKKFV